MTIDTMGERYGLLPSEVLNRATTFDLFVIDTALAYRNAVTARESNRTNSRPPESYSQEELLKIMEETRGESKS